MTPAIPRPPGTWWEVTFADLRVAEAFLDRLENHGVAERTLTVVGFSRFLVRWR